MIYERIRNLREDHDLTQTVLASYLHISQRAYSRYETGERGIPTETLILLAKYYRTSVDYLLGLTDTFQAYPPKKTRKHPKIQG